MQPEAQERNTEARNRIRLARYLSQCLRDLNITYREAARDLQIDPRRIRYLSRTSPQLRILHPLGAYIEAKTRERLKGATSQPGM